MSGTSLDGMDMVRARFFPGADGELGWEILDLASSSWPDDLREELAALAGGQARPAADFARLHFELARVFAAFVLENIDDRPPADLAAFPGQTLFHDGDAGLGLQIGNPAVFALLTGVETVGDFRSPDLALGGQGAPLVPLADAWLRRDAREYRAILNIGGIANLTLLPPGRGSEGVLAWDCGPGNILMDLVCRGLFDEPCDRDGRRAAAGRLREDLLETWLAHPWFARRPPKSTGRELFGTEFLPPEELAALAGKVGAEDLLATLAQLTATAVIRDLAGVGVDRLFVAGGGAANPELMDRLREGLAPMPVESIDRLGVPAQSREALDFALLAYLSRLGLPVSLPAVTGARRAAPAGLIAPVSPRDRNKE